MNAKGPDPNATQRMLLEGQLASAQSSAGDSLARLAFERALGALNERAAALEALHEQIARARARAVETEIDTLGAYLVQLHREGTLPLYVQRRRAEVLAESRALFVREGA